MKIQEVERRLRILNLKEVPIINKRMLRGGMQERLHRQDINRYKKDIDRQKNDLNCKLNLLEAEKDSDFSVMSFSSASAVTLSSDSIPAFNEPKLKRIRNKRNFF